MLQASKVTMSFTRCIAICNLLALLQLQLPSHRLPECMFLAILFSIQSCLVVYAPASQQFMFVSGHIAPPHQVYLHHPLPDRLEHVQVVGCQFPPPGPTNVMEPMVWELPLEIIGNPASNTTDNPRIPNMSPGMQPRSWGNCLNVGVSKLCKQYVKPCCSSLGLKSPTKWWCIPMTTWEDWMPDTKCSYNKNAVKTKAWTSLATMHDNFNGRKCHSRKKIVGGIVTSTLIMSIVPLFWLTTTLFQT